MKASLGKKLRRSSLIVSSVAIGFTILTLLPTLTWYNIDTHSEIDIEGNVHGSYFESGSGTAADPFEIARPIQMYFLAWLQEMGYFNESVVDSTTNTTSIKQQYHFYLSKDIDMSVSTGEGAFTYELPPIGTIKYPFVGSFDGKGHTISHLKIQNDASEYTNDPVKAKDRTKTADSYEILGMFGVVGATGTTNVVNGSEIKGDGTIELISETATFTTSDNYIKNFYIEDITLNASTDSDHALVGAVAGYANATISGVGVKSSSIIFANGRQAVTSGVTGTSSSTVLSNYITVGYATDDNKRNISITDSKVYAPKATTKTYVANSAGSSWGGSINMPAMRKRIYSAKNMKVNRYTTSGLNGQTNQSIESNKVYPYNNRETYVNGTLTGETKTVNAANILSGETKGTSYYYSDKIAYGKASDKTIGSYYYVQQGSTGDGLKAYLGGYSDVGASSVKQVTRITEGASNETCYKIRTGSSAGSNYIQINENNSSYCAYNVTSANATVWHYNGTDLYARKTVNGHDTVYFLNYENNAYKVERSGNTNWTRTNNNFSGEAKTKFRIRQSNSGNNWLTASTTAISNSTSSNSATIWNIEGFGDSSKMTGTISCTISGTPYYLNVNANQNNDSVRIHTSPDDFWTRNTASSTNASFNCTFVSLTRFLRYSNGWKLNSSSANVYLEKDTSKTSTLYSETVTNQQSFTYEFSWERSGQAGYVPLSAKGDNTYDTSYNESSAVNVQNYYTSDMNTGYLVGGFYDRNNGKPSKYPSTHGSNYGDVRVSQYSQSKISSSYNYSTKAFTTVYTIDDSCYNGTGTNASQGSVKQFTPTSDYAKSLVKFTDSQKTCSDNMQKEKNWLSGIHFMDSSISMDKIITADTVYINGKTYENFEMPEDSIDFTLKEKGYINFFAGNYHGDNNSFFALHKIERNPDTNKIISMKKIELIFYCAANKNADFIYMYDDGTFSDGVTRNMTKDQAKTNGFTVDGNVYTCKFDTKWIGVNGTLIPTGGSRIYYFEIPVNSGEFALGSCEGGCGGYLIYLDISAAAQTIQRHTLNELFVKQTLATEIPNGVQYVGSIPDADDNKDDKTMMVRDTETLIDDLDTLVGNIDTSANGTYTVSRTNNNVTVTNPSGNTAETNTYVGTGLTVNSAAPPDTRPVVTTRRITDYDFNTATDTYVKQVTTIETVGTNNTVTTTIGYNTNASTGFNGTFTDVITFSYSFTGNTPDYSYSYYLLLSETSSNHIEINFNTLRSDFNIHISQLASGFILTCGTAETEYTSASLTETGLDITADKLSEYDVNKYDKYFFVNNNGTFTEQGSTTPTQLAKFHYVCQNEEEIVENFIYSFTGLQVINPYPTTDTLCNITDGAYEYDFILTGADPAPSSSDSSTHVHVWYYADGTINVQYGDGQYIHFIKSTTDGTWIKA